MSQRLTRKEIKRDEFTTAVERGVEYAESHARTLIWAIAAVVALAVIGVGGYALLSSRSTKANDALAAAVKVYNAPIEAAGAKPKDATSPSFPDEAARRARAKALLQKVRSDYGSSDAADVAGLYLAQIAMAEGKADEARKMWNDFVDDHPDSLLAGEARINLIHLDRKQGPKVKVEELATRLKAMMEQSEPPLPEDVLLSELGATYEQLGRKDDAIQAYKRILDEFPQSGYRQVAQEKLSALDPARTASPGAGAFPMVPGTPGAPGS
jgi:predicted negative regulator of RcsB-dependent stress response